MKKNKPKEQEKTTQKENQDTKKSESNNKSNPQETRESIKQTQNSNQKQDSSWMVLFTTDNITYTITSREQRYIFESDAQIRFYFDSAKKIYDSKSESIVKDHISVLSINKQPTSATNALGTLPFTTDQKWDIIGEYIGLDGYVDNKKLVVSFADSDNDGVVDDPEVFLNVVAPDYLPSTKYIVQQKYLISAGQEDYKYVANNPVTGPVIIRDKKENVPYGEKVNGQYFYFTSTGVVMKYIAATGLFAASLDYKVYQGRAGLKFQYIHSADYDSRIDAGASNIIDVYVLTKTYDTRFRQWIAGTLAAEPLPPGTDELHDALAPSLDLIKSISDEIVYHPVKYKVLFGSSASPELQATFKVVKNPSQVVSDNDIKSRVVNAINQFFLLSNWDFGDTFYFTELSTYVVTQLTPDISSFVIVPKQSGLSFGSLFEIKSGSNELFISSAIVDDVEIILGITASTIKAIAGTTVTSNVSEQQTITSSQFDVS